MEKSKKIKLFIGLFYIIAVCTFLFFFFSKFTFEEITSYEFIKNNRNYFFDLRKSNFFLLSILFLLFTIIWVFAAGFGSPIALLAGFIFGKWFGLLIIIFGMSIGASALYIFANYFLKEMIREKFLNRFQSLEEKFKRSELIYLLIYRFVGGIPFALSNVIPCIFNVKLKNFFLATFIGMLPQLFLIVSIGSGLEKMIDQNLKAPSIFELIMSKDIYIPLIAFLALLIITYFIKNIFYKR
tara:strand:- start:5845 stop:6564 length:720 start_codon:yes stop_codon:yes gene_type:complete